MSATEHDSTFCTRCRCCDLDWVDCDRCGGEGLDGHDCGEDCCACLYPEENEVCDQCDGLGGWNMCLGRCDENGVHEKRGVGSR